MYYGHKKNVISVSLWVTLPSCQYRQHNVINVDMVMR